MSKNFSLEIQGLRAIAVLAVVIYHINPKILPAGYLGVDIFFVISGYLIIGHIWKQVRKNEFNLINFYTKRVKRLFPALFAMISVTVIAGYFILLPLETVALHKSVISSLFYFSNFYFYSISDYFNTTIHLSPLLHTWSLSVEEQFYIFFPLIMIVLAKNPKKILFFLSIIFLIFFILSIILVSIDQSLAFYSSPSRFFQFLAGGILSISTFRNSFSKKNNELLTLLGLTITIACLFIYTKNTVFPGVNAILPTIGTLLVIFSSSKSNYVNLILTNKYSQIIGNASYSIYLWHWPLIVYCKIYTGSFTKLEQISLFLASIIIGLISYKYIENKTRYITYKINPLITTIGISLIFTIFMISTLDGMKYRFTEKQVYLSDYLKYDKIDYREGTCFFSGKHKDSKAFNKKECIKYNPEKKNILIMGDSHAAMFNTTLQNKLPNNQTISQVTASGCRPLIGSEGKERCTDLMKYAFSTLIKKNNFDTIILAGRWWPRDFDKIKETILYLEKYSKNIIIIGRNIDFSNNLPRLLINNESSFINKSNLVHYNKINNIDIKMNNIIKADYKSTSYISMFTPFCNELGCEVLLNNIPIIYDTNHLTIEAMNYIYNEYLKNIIENKKNRI